MQITKPSIFKPPQWSFIVVLTAIISMIISGILPPASVSLAALGEGYVTFSFGSSATSEPAGEKPESKLWYNDGLWWGSLFNPNDEAYHIYRFNRGSQSWNDTGVRIDDRNDSKADVLWDQASQKLYVASHIFSTDATSSGVSSSNWGRLYRYSYHAGTKTYTLDPGYPVIITRGVSETLTIAKDSTGRLWVTYVEDSRVMVSHSVTYDATWTTPYVLPVTYKRVSQDDISSIIAFQGNKIGIVWSNQYISDTGMFMAIHVDGTADDQWQQETIVIGGDKADDHINLKTDSSGRLFVASKTGLWGSSDPLIVLHVRAAGGAWTMHTVTTVNERQTRPIVMLHLNENMVYVFARSDDDGSIRFKSSAINNVNFASGIGTVFIEDSSSRNLNNPSSTKQNVTSAMGMLVIADNDDNHHYYHNDALQGIVNPQPTSLIASATCYYRNLGVTIAAGDGPFNITASAGINTPVYGVNVGTTWIYGPEKWDHLTVTETQGDMQSIDLGQFKCRTDERPVPISPPHRFRTTNSFPVFTWSPISIANNYRVFVFDDANGARRTIDIRQNSGGATSLVLNTPLPNARLFWRVRGRQNRVWGLWSVRFTLFKDPVAPLQMNSPEPTVELRMPSADGSLPNSATTPAPTSTLPPPPNSR